MNSRHPNNTYAQLCMRLWRTDILCSPTGCWEWQGSRLANNYGQIQIDYKMHLAHRLSYSLAYGEIPANQVVRHTCDNPPCVNPSHLVAGTQAENLEDMYARHRKKDFRHVRGETNGNAVLTWEKVKTIRQRYAEGNVLLRELAKEYNTHVSNISLIVRYHTWQEPEQGHETMVAKARAAREPL